MIPTYCPDCEGACGSELDGAVCWCVECPRCEELATLDRAAVARWLDTTVNPQGRSA